MDNDENCDLVENCEFCGIKMELDEDPCECPECIRKCNFRKRTLCEDCAQPICGLCDVEEWYTCKDHADKYELFDMRHMNEGYDDRVW